MDKKFPSLAPLEHLDVWNNGFKPYQECLDEIFKDTTIRNIAVMGPRGSGKSSILHSFNNGRPKEGNEEKEFLYVSLIDFEGGEQEKTEEAQTNTHSTTEAGQNATPSGDAPTKKGEKEEKAERDKTKSRLEYSLLCQVLVRCGAGDLVGCSLKGVPEAPSDFKKPAGYLALMAGLLFVMVFEERLGAALRWLNLDVGWRVSLHALLYLVFGGLLCYGVFVMFRQLLPTLRLQNLTVKHDKAELALAVEDGRLCLDQYKFELIAILDRIYDRIDGTVVFEDMERLDEPVCVEIMTKLRELNGLINTYRKQQGCGDRPIRFIYVLSDDVFSGEERSKFFDFIMPVVPVANEKNADTELMLMLNSFGLDRSRCAEILNQFPPARKDMRTVRNIAGEFRLMMNICKANGYQDPDINREALLRLTCCKVLYPRELANTLLWGALGSAGGNTPEQILGTKEQRTKFDQACWPLLYPHEQITQKQMDILKKGTVGEKWNLLCGMRERPNGAVVQRIWQEDLLLHETDPELQRKLKLLLRESVPPEGWLVLRLAKLFVSKGEDAESILPYIIAMLDMLNNDEIERACDLGSGFKLSEILKIMPSYPRIDCSIWDVPKDECKRILQILLSDLSQAERDKTVAKLLDPSVPGNDTEQPDAAGSTPTETPV